MKKLILAAVLCGRLLLFSPVTAEACLGDCSSDNAVTVDELLLGVNIALGNADASQCVPFDSNNDQQVTIDEILNAVNNALNGCPMGEFAGDYSGDVSFDATHSGTLDLSADANGHVSGSLVVSNMLRARFQPDFSFTFPAAGFSVTVSGTYDASTGSFEVDGSFVDGNGQSTSVNINGSLPGPMGSAAISVKVNDDVFGATLDASAPPMPTPTATPMSNPTPPAGGCSDGIFVTTFSNASSDTNADTSTLTLGKTQALDQPDPSTGTFIWVISGSGCDPFSGQVLRGLTLQGIAMTSRIQPGTYALGTSTPPFLNVTYVETKFTLFTHNWSSTGGTLVITDLGDGKLQLHATGVTMVKGLVFQGAVGTFNLEINGTISNVMHNG